MLAKAGGLEQEGKLECTHACLLSAAFLMSRFSVQAPESLFSPLQSSPQGREGAGAAAEGPGSCLPGPLHAGLLSMAFPRARRWERGWRLAHHLRLCPPPWVKVTEGLELFALAPSCTWARFPWFQDGDQADVGILWIGLFWIACHP